MCIIWVLQLNITCFSPSWCLGAVRSCRCLCVVNLVVFLSFISLPVFTVSQCLPIPYSLFTSDIKLFLKFMCRRFKNKKKNPSIAVLLDFDWALSFKSYWHLHISSLWTTGPAQLMDSGMTGIGRREGEDMLSLHTLSVKEIFRNWLEVPLETEFCCSGVSMQW